MMSESDEEWTRVLTERPPDRHEEDSQYVQGVSENRFTLLELVPAHNVDLSPGTRLAIESGDILGIHQRLRYQALTQAAQERLKGTVEAIITDNEQQFIEFYNNAQPIGLRKHQLDVLAGIGETRREAIIDERRRGPFSDFADLETRVDSLHSPQQLLVERVLTEFSDAEELRYTFFVN
jgi:putative nucleotide binding protein